MADKMAVDAVNGEREEEKVGPAQTDVPPERSTFKMCHHAILINGSR